MLNFQGTQLQIVKLGLKNSKNHAPGVFLQALFIVDCSDTAFKQLKINRYNTN